VRHRRPARQRVRRALPRRSGDERVGHGLPRASGNQCPSSARAKARPTFSPRAKSAPRAKTASGRESADRLARRCECIRVGWASAHAPAGRRWHWMRCIPERTWFSRFSLRLPRLCARKILTLRQRFLPLTLCGTGGLPVGRQACPPVGSCRVGFQPARRFCVALAACPPVGSCRVGFSPPILFLRAG